MTERMIPAQQTNLAVFFILLPMFVNMLNLPFFSYTGLPRTKASLLIQLFQQAKGHGFKLFFAVFFMRRTEKSRTEKRFLLQAGYKIIRTFATFSHFCYSIVKYATAGNNNLKP